MKPRGTPRAWPPTCYDRSVGFWSRWRSLKPVTTSIRGLREGARVSLEGQVDAIHVLTDPLSGVPAVAVDYQARMPGALEHIYPGLMGSPAQSVQRLQQAVPFLLQGRDGTVRILPPDPGGDVTALHERLMERYGIELLASTTSIEPGQRLRVEGAVIDAQESDPQRGTPWIATVRATALVVIDPPDAPRAGLQPS